MLNLTALLKKFNNNENYILGKNDLPSQDWVQEVQEALKYTPDAAELEQTRMQKLFVCDDLMIGGCDHALINGYAMPLASSAQTMHKYSFFKKNEDVKRAIPFEAWAKGMFAPTTSMGGNRDLSLRYRKTGYEEVKDTKGNVWSELKYSGYEESKVDPQMELTRIPGRKYYPIRGELYAILSTKFVETLDKFYENGIMFVRRRVPIEVKGIQQFTTKDGSIIRQPYQKRIDSWMYVAVPSYWINLIDGGYEYSEVKHIENRVLEGNDWKLKGYYWYNDF